MFPTGCVPLVGSVVGRDPRSPARPSESSWQARPVISLAVEFGQTMDLIVILLRVAVETGRS